MPKAAAARAPAVVPSVAASAKQAPESKKRISFAERPQEIQIPRDESQKTFVDEVDEIPDMDNPPSKQQQQPEQRQANPISENNNGNSPWMVDFWKMIINIFFLQWIQQAQQRQQLKNTPESNNNIDEEEEESSTDEVDEVKKGGNDELNEVKKGGN